MLVIVGPDGIRFIHDDVLAEILKGLKGLGPQRTKRASHVEPEGEAWTADMSPVGGPKLGPYASRGEALAAEFRYLVEHGVPEPE